jgi:hypothetical protein
MPGVLRTVTFLITRRLLRLVGLGVRWPAGTCSVSDPGPAELTVYDPAGTVFVVALGHPSEPVERRALLGEGRRGPQPLMK